MAIALRPLASGHVGVMSTDNRLQPIDRVFSAEDAEWIKALVAREIDLARADYRHSIVAYLRGALNNLPLEFDQ